MFLVGCLVAYEVVRNEEGKYVGRPSGKAVRIKYLACVRKRIKAGGKVRRKEELQSSGVPVKCNSKGSDFLITT